MKRFFYVGVLRYKQLVEIRAQISLPNQPKAQNRKNTYKKPFHL